MYDYQNRESHLKGKIGGGGTWVYGKFDYFTEWEINVVVKLITEWGELGGNITNQPPCPNLDSGRGKLHYTYQVREKSTV